MYGLHPLVFQVNNLQGDHKAKKLYVILMKTTFSKFVYEK